MKSLPSTSKRTRYNCSGFISAWSGSIFEFKSGMRVRIIHEVDHLNGGGNQFNWTSQHMVKQAESFMDWFKKTFHQNPAHVYLIRPALLFDNATVHNARDPDALNTAKLNVNPGGKQPKMKDDCYFDNDGDEIIQKMQFEVRTPKGMKQILTERGYNVVGILKKGMQELTSAEPDFQEDLRHNVLIHAIRNENDHAEVLHSPKFHCELNPKEMHWNEGKRIYRNGRFQE